MNPNNRRGGILQAEYIIHVKEIKPWPPSQSLNSLRSVMIQWENGSQSLGSTSLVVPSLGSVVGEGKIEFNESFNLSVALPRVMSLRSSSFKAFQKNCLEFNLYEPRRDKAKGQLLGSAVIDWTEYGILTESVSVSALLNCRRNFRNISQPILFIDIQPVNNGLKKSLSRNSLARELSMDRRMSVFASKNNLAREMSMDRRSGESVLALMSEEYAEEAAVPSVTDDDGSSHSSATVASSAYESNEDSNPIEESSFESVKDGEPAVYSGPPTLQVSKVEKSNMAQVRFPNDSRKALSSFFSASPVKVDTIISNLSETTSGPASTAEEAFLHTLPSSAGNKFLKESFSHSENANENLADKGQGKVNNIQETTKTVSNVQQDTMLNISNSSIDNKSDNGEAGDEEALSQSPCERTLEEAANNITEYPSVMKVDNRHLSGEVEHYINEKDVHNLKGEKFSDITDTFSRESVLADKEAQSDNQDHLRKNISTANRLKHVKSVRSLSSFGKREISDRCAYFHEEDKEPVSSRTPKLSTSEIKRLKFHSRESNSFTDRKVQKLEQKIKMLEGELREAAAIEVALYSVVAEHGSSTNKVHAPARRLSRLYLHACEEKSRASAAKTSVSGLVLVAKACGNDVPRLMYWLSNCVVLRTIINLATGYPELLVSTGLDVEQDGVRCVDSDGDRSSRSSSLNWKETNHTKDGGFINVSDWGDSQTYISALEKLEGWIFSRIVESLWWQTLVPYMQCYRESFNNRISRNSENQELSSFSVELWKEAFKDASKRLCPVRAEKHICGCLPVLSRLIMEQCVARLDVAMFNAIFRDSADEVPTDPLSDPIGDPRVLPVPVGKSSFGAGAQLKNAIGNWSMRLEELFGSNDCGLSEDETEKNDEDDRHYVYAKYFSLLSTLSDLMMLPKDMLLNNSVRKEVCPIFGARLIKTLLDFHIPDEFCPDLVPVAVLNALESEDPNKFGDECISHVPCAASPPIYRPPSAHDLAYIIGKSGNPDLGNSSSSLLRKSYTSDDELEELCSPLRLILTDGNSSSAISIQGQKDDSSALRYQLLREIWQKSP